MILDDCESLLLRIPQMKMEDVMIWHGNSGTQHGSVIGVQAQRCRNREQKSGRKSESHFQVYEGKNNGSKSCNEIKQL